MSNKKPSEGKKLVLDAEYLRTVSPFSALPVDELVPVVAMAQPRIYAKGAQVTEDSIGSFHVIRHGRVRLYRLSPTGQTVTLSLLRAGTAFEIASSDPDSAPSSCGEAMDEDTVIYNLPATRVLQLIIGRPEAALQWIMSLRRQREAAFAHAETLALYGIEARVIRALLQLSAENASRRIEVTHQELADMIGTNREEVTKKLRRLRALGVITTQLRRPGIVIRDHAELRALVHQEPSNLR